MATTEKQLPLVPESISLWQFYATRSFLSDEGRPYDSSSIAEALEVPLEDAETILEIATQYEENYGSVKV